MINSRVQFEGVQVDTNLKNTQKILQIARLQHCYAIISQPSCPMRQAALVAALWRPMMKAR